MDSIVNIDFDKILRLLEAGTKNTKNLGVQMLNNIELPIKTKLSLLKAAKLNLLPFKGEVVKGYYYILKDKMIELVEK